MKRLIAAMLCMILTMLLATVACASPLTGDRGIGLWIVLMIVAAIVLIGVVIILLKKNKGPKN